MTTGISFELCRIGRFVELTEGAVSIFSGSGTFKLCCSGRFKEFTAEVQSIFSRKGNLSGKTLNINTAIARAISHQYFFKTELMMIHLNLTKYLLLQVLHIIRIMHVGKFAKPLIIFRTNICLYKVDVNNRDGVFSG